MIAFFLSGGVPMVFILLFGVAALGVAVRFAMRPRRADISPVGWLCGAIVASMVAGTCADIAAVCTHVPANPEWAHSPDLALILLTGLGESMSPGILGGAFLSLVCLAMAMGSRRLGVREG